MQYTSTLLAVCRTRVVYELSKMALPSLVSCSSVNRAPPGARVFMGSYPVWDSDFIFVPFSRHVDYFIFHVSFQSSKFSPIRHCVTFLLLFSASQSPTKASNEGAIAVLANEAITTQTPAPTPKLSTAASLKRSMTRR